MYRAYGYIEFMPVDVGFVTPVFIKNKDLFLEVISDGKISEFIPLPEMYRELLVRTSNDSGVWFVIGQECAYAFKENSKVIFGKGKELAVELQTLPFHEKIELGLESFFNTYLPPLDKKIALPDSASSEECLDGDIVHRGSQVEELISLTKKRMIHLEVVDGNLKVHFEEKPNLEILQEIRERRNELISFLRNASSQNPDREIHEIPVAEPQEKGYELSSVERSLWVQSQFEDASAAYNIFDVYIFEGDLSHSAFDYAFLSLIERHEILRTVFRSDEQGQVKQYIRPSEEIGFFIQLKNLQKGPDQDQELRALFRDELNTRFDLSSGPLLRTTLCQLDQRKWVFICVMPHIISDGWSVGILIQELLQLYNAYLKGEVNPLPALRIQYKDYSVWQQQQLKENALSHEKQYWLEQFAGELPVLELPSNKPRPVVKTYNGREVCLFLNAELIKGFKDLCRLEGATLFMGFLAAVNTLLYRYTNQRDIIIGSPIAGRHVADLEGQIGCYVNFLPIRTRFIEEGSFLQLMSEVKKIVLEAYERQLYPFDELVEALGIQNEKSRSPIFDVVVTLHYPNGNEIEHLQLPNNLRVSKYQIEDRGVSRFDLTFVFSPKNEGVRLALSYNTDIYEHWVIEQMARHLEQLISAVVTNPSQSIHQLDYLSKQEKHLLLEEFTDTAINYLEGKTLVELFEAQVKRTPDKPAIVFDGVVLTYKQLNRNANILAHFLRSQYNVAPDDLIGVKLDHSHRLIISMLAVLKSGAAYMPIDTDQPEERINYMVLDSGCKLVIDKEELHKARKEAHRYSDHNLPIISGPSNLAYVIYTSGTAGKPKGVLVEHRNLVELFTSDKLWFNFNDQDIWTFFHTFCFDFSVWEMYGALLFGGKLIIIPRAVAQNTRAFRQVLVDQQVTVLTQTPSAFYTLLNEDLDSKPSDLKVRYLILGGEALNPTRLRKWKDKYRSTKIVSIYGPTETTVHVTYKEITSTEIEENSSSIGRPIPTSYCYVLDQNQQLLPMGVWGELYIGGAGVCRGYLNREELTSKHFLADQFRRGARLFRTGDKVRILNNGELEYGGRIDEQVKIRGYRIELGEIENTLMAYPDIEVALVVPREGKEGEKELVLYVVSKKSLNATELRAFLSITLPDYMLPSRFVQLEHVPLTVNGKVNKKALPDPDMGSDVAYMAPRNEAEERLVSIWKEVLGVKKIGIRDNFFDLGGHSLKAVKVITLVSSAFNVKLDVQTLFRNPTIKDFVDAVLNADRLVDEDSLDKPISTVRKNRPE